LLNILIISLFDRRFRSSILTFDKSSCPKTEVELRRKNENKSMSSFFISRVIFELEVNSTTEINQKVKN